MKIEDIEITFGKSILVEKTQRMDFLHLVDSLCQKVPGSFLTCNVNSTGWVTIIRYSKNKETFDENYYSLRILMLKKINNEKIKNINSLRTIMCNQSYRERPYIMESESCGIFLMDSCPMLCCKESLPALITETYSNLIKIINLKGCNLSFILNDMTVPFTFCNRPNHCADLYGDIGVYIPTEEWYGDIGVYIPTEEWYVYSGDFNHLVRNVNNWKLKLKRKGIRALKKSITLRSIVKN